MTVFVYDGGRSMESGSTIVFLHGAGQDHSVWRFQTRWLAHRGWRVLAPDLPGHGRSGGKPRTSIEEWAEWTIGFLERRCPRNPVSLVGQSMGGLIGLEVAAGRADLLDHLVVVAAGGRMPVHPHLLAASDEDLPRAARLIAGWSLPATWRGAHPEPGTWEQGGVERLVERSPSGVLAADLEACAAYDGTSRLAGITVPTIVVVGSEDRMVGVDAGAAVADAVPGAALSVIEGAGHEPMLQAPRTFNRILSDFLGG